MSGGKGGTQTSQITIPDYIEEAARRNLAKAEDISQIGYMPYYGPDVAAFTPMQEASFQQAADVASAFGLAAPTTQADIMGGMPAPTQYAGGVRGYSAAPIYEQAVSELAARRPAQAEYLQSFFIDPMTGETIRDYSQPAVSPVAPMASPVAGGGGGSDGTSYIMPTGNPYADDYFGESIVDFVSGGGILGAFGDAIAGLSDTPSQSVARGLRRQGVETGGVGSGGVYTGGNR
jgi:hypothetical protein